MKAVQDQVRTWLLEQQDWLQEAADRILKHDALSEPDIQAITALLKSPDGQKVSKHRTFSGLITAATAPDELRLAAISKVYGIENLAPREPLAFGSGNLVVIYGHNGSGKSSYTRTLKKVSGKPRANELRPNVFRVPPAERKCTIAFQLGSTIQSIDWVANGDPIDSLRPVDIFDSNEANYYLTKENSATYTPPLVAMFESLASTCDQVRLRLQAEQDLLVSALPRLPPSFLGTEPARQFGSLRADLNEAKIEQLTAWTDDYAQALKTLTERLKIADPVAVAKQKRATRAQAAQIAEALELAMAAYRLEGLTTIRSLKSQAHAKRKIAVEAAQIHSAKLDGVGSATWRALWDAAKAYSQTAYPAQAFPVTDSARCVLCHQELAADAQERLKDFENFVRSKLELDAQTVERAYSVCLDLLLPVPTDAQLQTQCEAAGLVDGTWSSYLAAFWNEVRQARLRLLSQEVEGAAAPVQDASDALTSLRTYCDQLESQAAQCDRDVLAFDRVKAANEKLSLETQQWISQQADAVRKEIDRLKSLRTYENWKTLANPRKVSVKAGEVAEQIITQAYVGRFNQELILVGATRIQVEIVKTRTERGKVLHQLRLRGANDGQAVPDSILSDGERRIIALAAFLADVADKPQIAPFVFDDPISSLDHDFEWGVATRLAALSQTRQVLIFTHRLSLYGAMEDAARKIGEKWKDQHLTQLCIETYSNAAGHPVAQSVWNAKTESANNILLERLALAKLAGNTSGGEAYRALAQGICSDFRKLLERTVEDDLLFAIVKRHRRSVTTDNKLSTLSLIKPADCQFIDGLMTKYSCYEHSQSQEAPIFVAEEPELRNDIESLKQWRKEFVGRRKVAAT